MATAIRTIKHEDRLSLIEHLDELRTRLIVSAIALAVAFGFCLWQNHALLHLINKPLEKQTQKQVNSGNGPLGQVAVTQKALLAVSTLEKQTIATLSAPGSGLSPAAAAKLGAVAGQIDAAVAKIPRVPTGDKPVTLGIGEPFTTTITVTFYFALLFSLPVILFQLYSFILPAFSPGERQIALPLMLAIPFLFATGVIFGYFVVVPASVKFFQNFNSGQFNVLVQAGPYLKFVTLLMLAMGLIFQVPVGILAATRAGMITPAQLRTNRRYAVVVAAVIVALLPGDLVTMALEAAPLIVLYELSIAIASFVDRRVKRREAREAADAAVPAPVPATAEPVPSPAAEAPPPVPPVPPAVPSVLPVPPAVPPVRAVPPAVPPAPPGAESPAAAGPAPPRPSGKPPSLIPPVAPPIRPHEEEDDDAL